MTSGISKSIIILTGPTEIIGEDMEPRRSKNPVLNSKVTSSVFRIG